VISRSHFRCDTEIVAATIRAIRKIGRYVKPTKHADGCSDPDDNMFLECAEAAHADFIVTGNQRHFPAEWKKTRVIGVRELIEILIQQED